MQKESIFVGCAHDANAVSHGARHQGRKEVMMASALRICMGTLTASRLAVSVAEPAALTLAYTISVLAGLPASARVHVRATPAGVCLLSGSHGSVSVSAFCNEDARVRGQGQG